MVISIPHGTWYHALVPKKIKFWHYHPQVTMYCVA
jgi:hypothetical protein